MIIARYISKQVFVITSAITFILLVVVVVGRMLQYLAQASQGEIDADVLALLMSYRMPEFVQLTIPLALALGVLLTYGRLYAENEMTVMIACGLSRIRLLLITFIPATFFTLFVAVFALMVTPWGLVNSDRLLEAQQELTEFDVLVPGVFQSMSRGARTTYAETVRSNVMDNVFMHEREPGRVTVAGTAVAQQGDDGQRFILMSEGSIVEGLSGREAYSVIRFDELGVRLPERELSIEVSIEEKAMATLELLGTGEASKQAELQWRLSLVILVPVLMVLVVPLSRVSPREGRFARLVPAILIYIFYFGLLLASRDLVADGRLSPLVGLWWVHLLFLGLGLLLFLDKLPNVLRRA